MNNNTGRYLQNWLNKEHGPTLYASTIWSTTPHVEHRSNICRTLGCHFEDLTVDLSHLYDNDNSKTSWSEVYAAFEGEWGGRQGCGLDLAPFWYTSPFKLSAPFHLISPLSVGFPRNRFCHVSVSWRLLVVYESIQIKSTILIAFSTVLQRSTLFVPWALGDSLLLYISPFKLHPLFGSFDCTFF